MPLKRGPLSLSGSPPTVTRRVCSPKLAPTPRRIVCRVDGNDISYREGKPERDVHKNRRQTETNQRLMDIAASLSNDDGVVTGSAAAARPSQSASTGNGVFWLCCANCLLFALDHVFRFAWVKSLYLNHQAHRWWQLLSSAFCHMNWDHLSSNVFMLYIFGRIVEDEEGALGVWFTYIVCALGANLVSLYALPNVISLGASAAVFGLFIVSVLLKLSWNIKKLLEAAILGQFVYQQVKQEFEFQVRGGMLTAGDQVNHLAHLSGAMVGALLVLLLKQLPDTQKAN